MCRSRASIRSARSVTASLAKAFREIDAVANPFAADIGIVDRAPVDRDQLPRRIAGHPVGKGRLDLGCQQGKAGRDIGAVVAEIFAEEGKSVEPFGAIIDRQFDIPLLFRQQRRIAAGGDRGQHGFAIAEVEDRDIGGDDDRIAELGDTRCCFLANRGGGEHQPVQWLPGQAKAEFDQPAEVGQVGIAEIAVDRQFADRFHDIDILVGQRDIDIDPGAQLIAAEVRRGDNAAACFPAVQIFPVIAAA